MPVLAPAICPHCQALFPVRVADVEPVLAVASQLEQHIAEVHRLSYSEAFRISERWALETCLKVLEAERTERKERAS